jgi:hypothetical protein
VEALSDIAAVTPDATDDVDLDPDVKTWSLRSSRPKPDVSAAGGVVECAADLVHLLWPECRDWLGQEYLGYSA